MFTINHKLPAILSIPFIALGFLLTFWLKEPYPVQKKVSLTKAFKHAKESLVHSWKHDYVRYLILLVIPIHPAIHMTLSMSSVYLEQIMIPIALIGVVAFFTTLVTAYTSRKAYKLEEKLGDKKSLLIIQIILLIGLATMSFMIPYIGVLFFCLIPLAQGFYQVLVNHFINVHIETSHRATILSVQNMSGSLSFAMLFPIFGKLADTSIQNSFIFATIVFAVYFTILFLYSKRLNITTHKYL